ncbi:thiamine diphosphokinase [Deinococcus cellulosilyticus]|uniref:Thiamine diphosphokinase n=1 Tax=Deinococcus cellulosilyticus (strain DSM 18568 / NBRC 106333 / KACC 11606 / 5516J-15) TaxID=1223518 RepID=A0A511N4C5_DEIC1|nr:thiamine diphosphokinase [Deinococcus cellulosilyticus]GEM47675.1 thiamine pyrophosphokinase [Deinococcus cellulosilyticus NBRC 106333 = KACC 11606]
MICYVLINGELHPTAHMQHILETSPPDLVVVADGGIQHVETLGVKPDVWMGDFDSTPEEALHRYPDLERIPYPADKDLLDSEIALEYALERGAKTVIVWGALGGRTDHTLAAILLATRFPQIQLMLHSGTESVHPLHPHQPLILSTVLEQTLSVLSILPLHHLNIRGVRWELFDANVERGSGWTMSNVAVGDQVNIWIEQGLGVVIVQHE